MLCMQACVCVCVELRIYACVSISPSTRKGAVDDIRDIPFTATPHLGHPHLVHRPIHMGRGVVCRAKDDDGLCMQLCLRRRVAQMLWSLDLTLMALSMARARPGPARGAR